MKIIVKSEIGRDVNPKAYQKFFCDTWTKITNGICIDLTKCDCEEYRLFEQSVTTYPAPHLNDGEYEAILVWEYYDVVTDVWRVDKRAKDFKGCDKRQIWRATESTKNIASPSLKEAEVKQDGWIKCSDRLPEVEKKVWGALQHWHTKNYRYAEIKKVNESDCDFRTVDDNSEISHDWAVTHWQPLPEQPTNK